MLAYLPLIVRECRGVEFVPGLASEYKVLGLSTEAMERLFGAAGKGAEEATKEEVEV